VWAFGGESEAAADRCDRTGAPTARKPNERSECRRLRLNKKHPALPVMASFGGESEAAADRCDRTGAVPAA